MNSAGAIVGNWFNSNQSRSAFYAAPCDTNCELPVTVSQPGTVALLGLGLAGLGLSRRRKAN